VACIVGFGHDRLGSKAVGNNFRFAPAFRTYTVLDARLKADAMVLDFQGQQGGLSRRSDSWLVGASSTEAVLCP